MKDWQNMITLGNQAFSQKDYEQADALYQQAKDIAELSISQPNAGDDQVMALLVSHFNLSDLYIELNLADQGRNQLQELYEILVSKQKNTSSERLSQALSRGLYKCRTQIMLFDKQHQTQVPSCTHSSYDDRVQDYLH